MAETFFSKAGSKDFPRLTIRLNSFSNPLSDVRMIFIVQPFASCPAPYALTRFMLAPSAVSFFSMVW